MDAWLKSIVMLVLSTLDRQRMLIQTASLHLFDSKSLIQASLVVLHPAQKASKGQIATGKGSKEKVLCKAVEEPGV